MSEVNKDLEIDIITKLNLKFKNKTLKKRYTDGFLQLFKKNFIDIILILYLLIFPLLYYIF